MRYEDASNAGAFQGSEPIANDDMDSLAAGSKSPATGNLISGEGTQTGSSGADSAAGAHVTAIAGKGGEDTSFAGGKLNVSGEHGKLSVDAEGNYSYLANQGVENVRDRFTYTLADSQGNSDTAALIVEIGKTPVVIKADAQQIVPGPDGVVTLPPGVELSDIMVVGRNLVINLPDGTQLIIIDGAVFVPQLVLDGVSIPATNVAALLVGQEPQPAAGETPPSSGGNFALPPPPLDPGVPLGDLLPPTEYDYTPPEPQELFPEEDSEPEIFVQPDGQPASVNAVDEVDEAGLPERNEGEPEGSGEEAAAGDNGDPSEATSGLIIYNSPDGVDTITINGVVVTSVGQVINGSFGTLVITSIAEGQIGYSYTLVDNTSGDATHDDFSVVLTDSDGDVASATLTINIIDDVPTARPDTDSIPAGEYGPATGNVITDAAAGDVGDSDTNAADTVGADDATLTSVSGAGGSDSTFDEGGNLVVNGQYGVLTIDAEGNYSYVRNQGTPGGVTDVFNYTLTDGDGDTTTSTLTISIGDLEPETGENPTALLDDDALANGNPGGVDDDVDAANLSGFLSASGGDSPLTYDLLLTGAPAGFTYVDGPAGAVHVMQGGTHVLTITINSATGAYTVSQINPIDHPAGSDENNVSFTINYQVTDLDGDTANGTLDINVDDDTPEVNAELNQEGAVTVDESGPTGASTINFGGAEGDDENVAGSGPIGRAVGATALVDANALFGADGPSGSGLTYSLQLGGSDTDLTLTDGSAIQLQLINGVIVGVVTEGPHSGEAAFAIAINPATGVATVELYLSLDHPVNPNPNDSLPLGPNTVDVVVSATDGDGDTVTSDPVDVSGQFNFLDDGPSIDAELNADATVTVDESLPSGAPAINTGAIVKGDDPDLAGGFALGQANSGSAIVDANAVFGADGPAAGGGISYALSITTANPGVTLTDGTTITMQLVGGVIVGVVDAGPFAGQAAFAISIDPATGVVTVEQYLSLDHPVNPDPNDPLGLGDNTVAVTVTVTDGDGDPVTSDGIDISGQITFLDDGPSVDAVLNEVSAAIVDESLPVAAAAINTGAIVKGDDPHLAGGLAIGSGSTSGAVIDPNAVFGADGPAAANSLVYDLVILNEDSGLTTTEGDPINLVELPSGVIVGVVQGGDFDGQAAFAISIDPVTGVVTVEQYLSLDHPIFPNNFDEPVFLGEGVLGATVTATDGDGDPVTSDAVDVGSLIRFEDDGPSATDEPQQNVPEGNQTVSGTFDFVGGADGATVTHINGIVLVFGPGGFSQWIPVDDGQIRAQADGDYEFQSDVSGSGVTSGTFTVTDGDGDQVTANWAFNITDANFPTAGVSAARLDDDGLTGGNPASVTGDIDANVGEIPVVNPEEDIFHGQLTLNFGGDGPGTVTFAAMHGVVAAVGTENVTYSWNAGTSTLTATVTGGSRNGTVLFDIVVNQTTGEYTLTLYDNVIHAAGGDEASAPNVALTYTVTDSDNSPPGGVNGTLNITFNDDAPTLSNVQPGSGVDLDETDAGSPSGFPISDTSVGAVISATQAFGADGAAAANSVVYGLAIVGGSPEPSGLATAIGNFAITLVQIDGDTIEGQYQDGGTQVAFTIQINGDGTVTLTQEVPLEHLSDGGPAFHNDTLDLTGLINATVTITDGDGDTASASAPIGDNLVFFDDGPDAQVNVDATLDQLVLDETRPVGTESDGDSAPAGLMTVQANFANNFVSPADHGADGPGTVSYSLFLSAASVGSGLYALDAADIIAGGDGDGIGQGAQIMLSISPDGLTITGSVGLTNYFTISIDPVTGVVTFTQLLNVWHASTASDDDTSTLTTAAAANVQVVQTVTDSDGDFDTASINVGTGVFHIEDDGPTAYLPDDAEVENGSLTPVIESLNLDIGTDGFGLLFFDPSIDGDPAMDADGNALFFNGQPLFYQVNGNVLTAETAGNVVGFTITLNTNGTYTFELEGVISNGTETSFTDLTSSAAGNVDFRLVGEDDDTNNADNIDIILSGRSDDGSQGTINTDSDSIGVDSQAVNPGAAVRIDLVSNLEVAIVLPDDLGEMNGPQGFRHGGHVETTHFEQFIPQVQGSQTEVVSIVVHAILADDDNDYDNTPDVLETGETRATIHTVTVNSFDGGTVVFEIGDAPVGTPIVGLEGITVTFLANGSVQIDGLQQGDQYEIDTSTDFNAIIVESPVSNSNDFDLGIFTIGSEGAGTPIVQDFDIVAQDADGDQQDGTISTTINPPAESLALSSFSSLSSDSQDQQLQKSAANSNTLTLAAAVAAAGMGSKAAASEHQTNDVDRSGGNDHSAAHSAKSAEQFSAADDADGPAVSTLIADAPANDDAPADSSSSSSADSSSGDNVLDDSAASAASEPSEPAAANDQGPANDAAFVATAPTVGMPSAEALQAAAGDDDAQGGDVEAVLADALGEGAAPTVDALLASLPGGENGGHAGLSDVASHGAGGVPGWDMGGSGAYDSASHMLFNLNVAQFHQDAVQPAVNG